MKITKISFSNSFQISEGVWEKIGMEGELTENDNPQTSLEELKERVQSFHKYSNPQLYPNGNEPLVNHFGAREIQKEEQPEEKRIALMISDILGCKELDGVDGLLSFRVCVERESEKYPEIKSAYYIMLNKLSGK